MFIAVLTYDIGQRMYMCLGGGMVQAPLQKHEGEKNNGEPFFRRFISGLTKSRGFAWPQVLCTGPVGIFSVVSRFDALERKCEKSLGVEVQIVRQPARKSDGFAIPRPDGLRFADRRNRL